jgi:predicted NBD/HSP70 family sugar kinase
MKKSLNFSRTISSDLQFKINTSIIFNYLKENSFISRADISRNLNISFPSVSRVINKLIEGNYVIETEKVKTKVGKRPILLKINENSGYIISIDLGKEKLKIVVTNLKNLVVENIKSFKIENYKNISERIINELESIIKKFSNEGKKVKEIKAISIGIPADIDINTGKIISAPLYSNWKDLNLKASIEEKLGIVTFVENDVNLSAIGEKYFGVGKTYKDLVFIEISNGIGAGIIIDNYLFRGSTGAAGEIGYTILNAENFNFNNDNLFLENSASIPSFKEIAIKEIEKGRETVLSDLIYGKNEISALTICQSAIKGDPLSREIIERVTRFLSIGIMNLIIILNPEIIVLGGEIINLPNFKELFLNPIKKNIENILPFDLPEITISSLGEDSGTMGASSMAIEILLRNEFPYSIE